MSRYRWEGKIDWEITGPIDDICRPAKLDGDWWSVIVLSSGDGLYKLDLLVPTAPALRVGQKFDMVDGRRVIGHVEVLRELEAADAQMTGSRRT